MDGVGPGKAATDVASPDRVGSRQADQAGRARFRPGCQENADSGFSDACALVRPGG